MKIDYQWGQPPKQKTCAVARAAKRVFSRPPVPMHMSDHYVREHFHPDEQGKLF